MRWLPFAIIAILTVTLHTTVGPRLALYGVRPDWILVVVVFFALHVRSIDTVPAGWVLGLLADLQSAERFGLMSIAYGLAALIVHLLREHVFRMHPLAHFAVTLAAGVIVQGVFALYCGLITGVGGGSLSAQLGSGMLIALYSALWAPLVHAVLLAAAPWLGVDTPRFTHARLSRR